MNHWKALALVMIRLPVVAVGLRFIFIEAHTFQLDGQKIFAINAAQNGLRDDMGNDRLNVTIQDHWYNLYRRG